MRCHLAQIATHIERLRALNLDIRVRGIASSKRMLLEETAVVARTSAWVTVKVKPVAGLALPEALKV